MKRKIIKISSALVLLIVLLTSTMIPALADSREDYAHYVSFPHFTVLEGELDSFNIGSQSVYATTNNDASVLIGVPDDFSLREGAYMSFSVFDSANTLPYAFYIKSKLIFMVLNSQLLVPSVSDEYIPFTDSSAMFEIYYIPLLDMMFLFFTCGDGVIYFEIDVGSLPDESDCISEAYFMVFSSPYYSAVGDSFTCDNFLYTEMPTMTTYTATIGYMLSVAPDQFLGEAYQQGFEEGGALGYEEGYADGLADGSASGGGNTDGSYDEGYSAGKTDGFNEGYAAGKTEGQVIGQDIGYTAGLAAGKELGYADGKADGLANLESEKQNSYNEGKADGIDEGYADGKADGLAEVEQKEEAAYNNGFTAGKTEGKAEGYTEGKADGLANLEKEKTDAYNNGYNVGFGWGEDYGYSEGYDSGWDAGREDGLITGAEVGYDSGFEDGKEVGYANGFAAGSYDNGYNDGYADGYDVGHFDGGVDGYSSAYNDGYVDGKYTGDLEGYNRGYGEGHTKGYANGMEEAAEIYYNQIYQDALDKIDQNQGTGVQGFLAGMWAGTQGFVQELLDGITFSGLSLRSIVTTCLAIALAAFLIRLLKG